MKVGSFRKTQEPNRNRFTGRTRFSLEAGTDGDERDRNAFPWRVRALEKADRQIREGSISKAYRSDLFSGRHRSIGHSEHAGRVLEAEEFLSLR